MPAVCATCDAEIPIGRKYCSRVCYFASLRGRKKPDGFGANLSRKLSGVPKPWACGEGNPNYGGKAQTAPEARANILAAARKRGLAWTDEDKRAHAERMRGSCNAMRGKKHTEATKRVLSEIATDRYKRGVVSRKTQRISKGEQQLADAIRAVGYSVEQQYHIDDVRFQYDIYVLSGNLIVEYFGDYWHANPAKYPAGTMLAIANRGLCRVEDIWAKDKQRQDDAESRGYKFVVVWESQFLKTPTETLQWILSLVTTS